ncbi:hypothetical protein RM531_08855 [Salinisphaera sp. P385]|uniref:DUF4878 domain-containing protein n=1 Tax=Spectribacter acetivorans TaxID=3075603 RepID=A0ABU3B9U5_9GAMM|nr:hypothetical protein [Salinisphaera sp. P385]MDT0618587.1 hypothetical protein [Salinisphaera sp. P385]
MTRSLAVLAAILALGCAAPQPSSDDIRNEILSLFISPGGVEYLQLANFERRAGYIDRQGAYVTRVAYDLIFPRSYDDMMGEARQLVANGRENDDLLLSMRAFRRQFGDFPAGHRTPMQHNLVLVQSDGEWKIDQSQ